jgi:addiction module HigA family antidote
MTRKLPPLHPGEVLREEFLEPYGLTAYKLARHCRVPRTRIERLIREETGLTTDTALRLSRAFDTTVEFWLHLQERYDVETKRAKLARELERIKPAKELEAA